MFPRSTPATVAVVGGGVSGLLAARRISAAGRQVILLESTPELGGHVRTMRIAGQPIDVGAEAVHLAVPATSRIVNDLALDDSLTGSRPGPTWLWTGRRRVLPAGVGPAGPTRIGPVLRSRVLGLGGLLRAGLEPLAARRAGALDLSSGHDISVGEFVTARFGSGVSDLFVDPLLGSLHSGQISQLSLRACAPGLVPAAREGRSLLRRRAPAPASKSPTPMFATWSGGLRTLTDALLEGSDVLVRTATAVTEVRPVQPLGSDPAPGLSPEAASATANTPRQYQLTLSGGETLTVDALVLAVNAPEAAALLDQQCPQAATTLRRTQIASTATLVLGFNREQTALLPALSGNGFLVPSTFGTLVKAGTHLSAKWAHLGEGSTTWYRLSAGRAGSPIINELDDEELVARARRDLRMITGIEAAPIHAHVQRWQRGLPQLTVGHVDRIAAVRAQLRECLPGIELAGASYDGIGIGACLASADLAAARLLDYLDASAEPRQ